ncbi:MAG: hypothetical protein AB8B52_09645 [Winogradskyella sp.]|uniref:hypothetical protein n=1 Tax=Winogradskyella sp. TaxID=1883156 RepID=UPI003859A271
MKLKSPYFVVFMLTLALLACAPEENNYTPEEPNNEFTFNGETYNLESLIIYDENTSTNEPGVIRLSLFNKESAVITSNADVNDVTYVYFEINATTLENSTYTTIQEYNVSINNSVVDSDFITGTTLLNHSDPASDLFAQSSAVNITNFTAFNIVFTFTFNRADGQVISGSYDGNYLAPNGIN